MTIQRAVSVHPGQPPVDNTPLREWLTRFVIGTNSALQGVITQLDFRTEYQSENLNPQIPTGVDTPLLVSWGSSSHDTANIMVNSSGEITFLVHDLFVLEGVLQISRAGEPSETLLLAYMEVNGTVAPFSHAISVDRPDQFVPLNFSFTISANPGDIVNIYIVRDSFGADDGGLYPFTPSLATIPTIPSASLTIKRITA